MTCCNDNGQLVQDAVTNPQCRPILIPPGDPVHAPYGTQCMNFVRTTSTRDRGCTPRAAPAVPVLIGQSVYLMLSLCTSSVSLVFAAGLHNLRVQYNNVGWCWDCCGVVAHRACSRMHTQAVSRPSWGNDVHLHYSVYAGAPTAPCVCFLKVETLFSCRDETSSTSKYFIVVIFLTVTMNPRF